MTQPRIRRPASSLLLGLLLAACSGSQDTDPSSGSLPADHPPISAAATTGPGGPGAVVLETMDSGGYTYARVAIGEDEMWAAGPQTQLAVGDTVSLKGPMPMSNFTSSTLDRTFEVILFVDAFTPGAPPAAPGRQGTVIQAMDAAGYTYLEVDVDGASVWLAGPQTALGEGDVVTWTDEMPMRGFTSTTLNRTFDEILFVNELVVTR